MTGPVDGAGSLAQPNDSDALYQALEARYPPTQGADYERLVVAHGNSVEPVHRWFRMKEAYSPYLLARVLKDLEIADDAPLSILDPFAGSGTTATSALLLERTEPTCVVGIEVNPFLALLARVKGQCLSLSSEERDQLADEVELGAQAVLGSRRGRSPSAPKLAAFGREEYFPSDSLTALMKMRANLTSSPPAWAATCSLSYSPQRLSHQAGFARTGGLSGLKLTRWSNRLVQVSSPEWGPLAPICARSGHLEQRQSSMEAPCSRSPGARSRTMPGTYVSSPRPTRTTSITQRSTSWRRGSSVSSPTLRAFVLNVAPRCEATRALSLRLKTAKPRSREGAKAMRPLQRRLLTTSRAS